ncbi:MAG TPA: hypothetical protein VMW22_03565 [Candidatus Desulfaltia sp.]|nr:hypothetical protein [Candidatus Desulfaltia sp.]
MSSEMGEYLVGAFLKIIMRCEIVTYNQRINQQREVDVIGFDFSKNEVNLCEVATHLGGLFYRGGNKDTVNRVRKKMMAIQEYAENTFPNMNKRIMFWSPYVPEGYMTEEFRKMEDELNISFIINEKYRENVQSLRKMAAEETKDRGEPFYRALQILEHLRK